MELSKVDSIPLRLFTIFIVLGELLHIVINTAPTLSLRVLYTGIYLFFCFKQVRLIPVFTAMNLIMERFSTVYGEFLPNTMFFHIAVLVFGYIQMRNLDNIQTGLYNRRDYVLFCFFALYVLVSAIYYADESFFLRFVFSYVFFHFILLSSDDHVKALIKCMIIAMSISCLFSFLNYGSIVSEYATSLGKANRLAWKDSNYLSFFIGVLFLISYFKYLYSNSISSKKIYAIVLLVFSISLLMLISRGTIVSLILVLLLYNWRSLCSFKLIKYVLFLFCLLLLAYQSGLLDGVMMRFMSDDMATGSGRTKIWTIGINTFFQKDYLTILFGAGEGNAINMALLKGIHFSPHNNYLELLFNYGVIGFLLFIFSWFLLFIRSKTTEKKVLILFFLINSMTIVPLTFVAPLWIIIPMLFMWDERINELLYE